MEAKFHSALNFVLILVVGFTLLPLRLWRRNTTYTSKRRLSGFLSELFKGEKNLLLMKVIQDVRARGMQNYMLMF